MIRKTNSRLNNQMVRSAVNTSKILLAVHGISDFYCNIRSNKNISLKTKTIDSMKSGLSQEKSDDIYRVQPSREEGHVRQKK